MSDLHGVRKGLGHAAAAIGREGAGCLDGVLEWLEGLELGGSSGRARCRQPQERDRRAAAASARGSSGRRGNSVEPRRPARAATARARGSGTPARVRPSSCQIPRRRRRGAALLHLLHHCGEGVPGQRERRVRRRPGGGGRRALTGGEGGRARRRAGGRRRRTLIPGSSLYKFKLKRSIIRQYQSSY